MRKRDWKVYGISNAEGVVFYVGCTSNLEQRRAAHLYESNTHNLRLRQWLAQSYFPPTFEVFHETQDRQEAFQAEAEYIDFIQPVFNHQGIRTFRL